MNINRYTLEASIEAWGVDPQIDMAIEEMAELIQALMNLKRNRGERPQKVQEAISEIADVTIMMEQLAIIFGESETQRFIYQKIDRLKNRIEASKLKNDY